MSDTKLVVTTVADHFNDPNKLMHCGPDALFKATFGSVSKRSIVTQLCNDDDERDELLHGKGRYAAMRQHPGIRNDDLYAYLRLGVSIHSAIAFQALGYPTPQSLTESPIISDMLPDVLVREDREYPLEFIDNCEREGITAADCQAALRRGISTQHLDGVLNTSQLIHTFNRYVRREGLGIAGGQQKNVIDYFVDGTLPVELQKDNTLAPEVMLNVVRTLLRIDPQLLEELRNDIPKFMKFIKASRTGIKNGVEELRNHMFWYGHEVLDLTNPYLCTSKFVDADGVKKTVGLKFAQYIESIMEEVSGPWALWGLKATNENISISGRQMRLIDLESMFTTGVTPEEIKTYIFDDGLTPAALILSKGEGIQRPLMTGLL